MKTAKSKPYDYFDAMERLRTQGRDMSAAELEQFKATVALNASDPEAVALYIDLGGDCWKDLYPPVPKSETMSTDKAIDTFLSTYGTTSPEEDELLERLIFNPVPEYGTILAAREKEEGASPEVKDEGNELSALARTINNTPQADKRNERRNNTKDAESASKENEKTKPARQRPISRRHPSGEGPTASLSFELAKIFIKQGHFEQAHDIISKIILNNPEKSIYFADQMRFLEKLIKIKNAQKN